MRRVALAGVVCAAIIVGCGDDEGTRAAKPDPTVDRGVAFGLERVRAPRRLTASQKRRFVTGRSLTVRSGCLACHRIGPSGNDGPGPDLSGVGAKRSPSTLRRDLLDPSAPMPSYDRLPASHLRALVFFLSHLDGRPVPPARRPPPAIRGLNCRDNGVSVRC